MKICVFGAASPKINSIYVESVERVGEKLAERNHELVFGAGANGLMGAAARGANRKNAKIYGIIPRFFEEENIEAIFDECDELIFTDSMRDRKQLMEDMADAFIVVPGGIGTFEELFEILTLKQLGRHDKPIVIYDIDNFYKEIIEAIEQAIKKGFINDACLSLYDYTNNIDEVFNLIENDEGLEYSVDELKEG